MKNARHSKILELIGQHSIDKQEELLAHLRRSGFEVTQATEEVEFICELRARAGEAWFELSSLKVVPLMTYGNK